MPHALSRVPIWLWLGWLILAVVFLYRAGLYPAAMTGDEIWFSESAYQFLLDGVPRRAIHADANGSAVADFLPPVVMLAQAASFLLFGLSAFAIGLPSALVPLGCSFLLYAAAKRWGAPTKAAGFAALALLGSQLFLRAGLYIRYEGLVVLCFLAYLAPSGERPGSWPKELWRGAALCLAGLSYYPTAPFLALAAVLVEWARWRRYPGSQSASLKSVLGFLIPTVLFGLYVISFPKEFLAQVLFNGSSNYLTFELLRHLADPAFWRSSAEAAPEILGLLILAMLAALRWGKEDTNGKILWLVALVLALPALLFPFQPRLLAGTMAISLLQLARWTHVLDWRRRLAWIGLILGGLAAAAMASIMVTTVRVQGFGRDAGAFAPIVSDMLIQPGAVGIDQRAWLALRLTQPRREVHHVMPSWAPPQVSVFESEILKDPAGGDRFAYLILDRITAEGSIARSPALKAAVEAKKLVPIARIDGAVTALPWSRNPPFDLIIYGPPGQAGN
ncbi:ArnT family glycosyltransferase [Lacibacterium aquatile]|uniref:ArnT family glycosyltransferase n=1 Tax=Lacibacterium aquatile TaxID=1168082 RepID=A0ABW5DNZ7_9PROT